MAQITLSHLAHSYVPNPTQGSQFALKEMDHIWQDGGAYALLGASGCGKTTLLNIISGLIRPSHGRVLFGDKDVTDLPTEARNIAQVFQFPVVYDTMTVRENLAFPLRNRGVAPERIRQRVGRIAEAQGHAGVVQSAGGHGRKRFAHPGDDALVQLCNHDGVDAWMLQQLAGGAAVTTAQVWALARQIFDPRQQVTAIVRAR